MAQGTIVRGDKAQIVIAIRHNIVRGDKAQTVIATNKAQTVIARGDKAQGPKSCNRHWERIRGWGGVDLHDSHKALAIWCGLERIRGWGGVDLHDSHKALAIWCGLDAKA